MDSELLLLKEALITAILAIEDIQFYLAVKEKFSQNQRIANLTEQQKGLQKELVNAKHIQKENLVSMLEQKLEAVILELEGIPLFQQFKSASEQAQEILDEMSKLINTELNINMLEEQA